MRRFTDNTGRSWVVAVTVDSVRRVRAAIDFDLMRLIDDKRQLARIVRDPVLLCDVLYVVCKPQADEQNVSDEDFGRAMAGDAIEHATEQLLNSLVDFCPSPRDRANLKQVLEVTRQVADRVRDGVEQEIREMDVEKLAQKVLANSGPSSGNTPASSA